jgi:hypothetical protein
MCVCTSATLLTLLLPADANMMQQWEGVTEEAKGVISDMLWRDPGGRATAAQLLARHWVGRGPAAVAATAAATAAAQLSALALQPPQLPLAGAATATNTAAAASLGVHVVRRLRMYSTQSRIKRLALVVYARTLGETDVAQLRVRAGGRAGRGGSCGVVRCGERCGIWYRLVLPGTAWYCLVLPGTAWYCLVLPGTAWYCLVLPGTA